MTFTIGSFRFARLYMARRSQFKRLFSFSSSSSLSSNTINPIIEIREDQVFPGHVSSYVKETIANAALRQSICPLRFFSVPEVGGNLNVSTHGYYYNGGLSERDKVRKLLSNNDEWQSHINATRPYILSQTSTLFVEAPIVQTFDLPGLSTIPDDQSTTTTTNDTIIEFRRYYLKLGYDTVPKFLEQYSSGLPSKLNAEGTDPTTSLVTLLYSEVGRLNEVIEIWKHGNGTLAMEQSRVAARGAKEWRTAISNIANLAIEFRSTIHKPLSFSPIR